MKEISVIRSRREPPMLRVPAWKSVGWPHEYDLMSNSVGAWMSCCQRGEELLLGVITG